MQSERDNMESSNGDIGSGYSVQLPAIGGKKFGIEPLDHNDDVKGGQEVRERWGAGPRRWGRGFELVSCMARRSKATEWSGLDTIPSGQRCCSNFHMVFQALRVPEQHLHHREQNVTVHQSHQPRSAPCEQIVSSTPPPHTLDISLGKRQYFVAIMWKKRTGK